MSITEFIDQLQSKYDTALQNQSLFFTPTKTSHLISNSGIQFEIACVTSLSKKPIEKKESSNELKKSEDPFSPPYVPDLFLCEFSMDDDDDSNPTEEEDSYAILLNKFSVVPRHFLLVTQAFKSQNSPPNPTDLYALFRILEQASSHELHNEWMSFYNCGPESGASQPHKHFQFIPVKKGSSPFGKLIESSAPAREGEIFSLPGLSYSHFIALVPALSESRQEEIEMKLGKIFMGLLDSMIDRLYHLPSSSSTTTTTSNLGSSKNQILSYNFVMTQKYMILVPRSKENFQDLNLAGHQFNISINSLAVAAGLILVKNVDSLQRLEHIGVDKILAAVTFPPLKDVIDPCSQG